MKAELISKAEYARRRGVAASAVTRAIKAGRITLIDGKIDPTVADVQWAANSRVRSGSRPSNWRTQSGPTAPADGEPSYLASRARREASEADLAELRLLEHRRELVRLKDISRALSGHAVRIRDAFLNLPARLSQQLAAESDERAVHALLDAEIRAVLTLVSNPPAELVS